jgi:tRNA C32,U32 (ribose-2'-O)-methylase TrmJ
MNLWKWRVVLVRPRIAGNLGATARIMANMGLNQLVLVAPEADPLDSKARQQATHGEEVLNQARIVPDFADAVADCHMVIGTSARIGGLFRRQSAGPPEEILPQVIES